MSICSGYPKRYNLYDLRNVDFKKDTAMWKESRGFIPSQTLSYTDEIGYEFLVIPLYSEDRFVSYQLRDIHDDVTETKYKLTKPVYDTIVKTDNHDIPGKKVICEGTIDCMILREHGINAWTCLGLKKFKVIRMLEELEGDKFIYVVDNDVSGKYFSKRYLSKQGICYSLPYIVKDVNELFIQDKSLFLRWLCNLKKLSNS